MNRMAIREALKSYPEEHDLPVLKIIRDMERAKKAKES